MEEYNTDYLPEGVQEFLDVSEEINKVSDNEAYDYFILYNSNGWKRLQEYVISIKEAVIYSSKQKLPEESLESYGASRMASDRIVDVIDNMINQVKVSAESYEQDKK
jgi:hypothetical protein